MSKDKSKKLAPVSNKDYHTSISKIISDRAAHRLNWYEEPQCGIAGLKEMMCKINYNPGIYRFPDYVFLYEKTVENGETRWLPVDDVVKHFNIDSELDGKLKEERTNGVACCVRYLSGDMFKLYDGGKGIKHDGALVRSDLVGAALKCITADAYFAYFPNFQKGEYAIVSRGLFKDEPQAWAVHICYEAKLFDVTVDDTRASGGGWSKFVDKHPHLFTENVYTPSIPLPLPYIPVDRGHQKNRELACSLFSSDLEKVTNKGMKHDGRGIGD